MEWLVLHRVGHDWSELAAAAAVCLLEKGLVPHSSTFAWKIPWTRSLVGCSPWGREESDTIEWLHFHFPLSCIGEGNGNPLQCSFLENPRDAEPSGLPSMGSHRVWHDWRDLAAAAAAEHPLDQMISAEIILVLHITWLVLCALSSTRRAVWLLMWILFWAG